jgi:hypothetical protein
LRKAVDRDRYALIGHGTPVDNARSGCSPPTKSPPEWALPRTTRSKAPNATKSGAVTPPTAEILISALVEALSGEQLNREFETASRESA